MVGSGVAPCPAFPAPFVCLHPSTGNSWRHPRVVPSLLLFLLLCCDLLLHSRCREGGAETGPCPISQVFYAVSRPSEAFSRVRRQKQRAECHPNPNPNPNTHIPTHTHQYVHVVTNSLKNINHWITGRRAHSCPSRGRRIIGQFGGAAWTSVAPPPPFLPSTLALPFICFFFFLIL